MPHANALSKTRNRQPLPSPAPPVTIWGVKGVLAVCWGLIGLNLLLLSAVYRLSLRGLEAFSSPLDARHWILLAAAVGSMAYLEGYRGFQKAFSPRVAARALFLSRHADLLEAILAPFFLMGYFRATRRRRITSISLTVGIVGLVLLVRLLPQPWRGLIDLAVVVGLAWGIVSLTCYTAQAFRSREFRHSPEIPAKRIARAEAGP